MSEPTPTRLTRGLEEQGYYELSTAERARLDRGLRFTPTVMLLAAVLGLTGRLPVVHAALAVIGMLSFLTPAHHPLDLLYNHVIRHPFKAPALPPNPLPRRLAILVASALNLAICFAFSGGRDALAYGLGAVLVGLQLVLVGSQFCAVSWAFERLVQARHRPERLLTGAEAQQLVADGALPVDVRSPREFANGHLPGAVNVPIDEFEQHVDELLEKHQPMVLYCAAGVRCNKAAQLLMKAGGREVHQLGTLRRWFEPA